MTSLNNHTRLLVFILSAVLLIGLSYRLAAGQVQTAQPTFADHPAVDATIAFWQKRILANPESYLEYSLIGEAYARKARETGDAVYYQKAEAALRRSLEINPGYAPASVGLAGALIAVHDFEGALKIAEPLSKHPRQAAALAIVGDAALALGDYRKGESAYRKLLELQPSAAAYSRMAALAEVYGRTDEALEWMQKALVTARSAGDFRENISWYYFQLGELYFRHGQTQRAEAYYRDALAVFPGYPLATGGLARTAAAQGDYNQAIQRYREATAVLPQPDLLAALGDVYMATGQTELAQQQYDTVAAIGRLAAVNAQVFNRQMVYFYVDHERQLAEAVRLAEAELAVRKDVYGYDAAAWASFKAEDIARADELIEQALRLGTRDARLYFHAGMIAQGRGERAEAKRLLKEALEINPNFDVLQARLAQQILDQLANDF